MVDKWGVSDDKKTYTFTLRAGQKFHDGQDVASATSSRRESAPFGGPRSRRAAPCQGASPFRR